MAKSPGTGTTAPDFELPGVVLRDGTAHRDTYRLGAHRGAPLVLAFYPGDNTPVCTKQLCSYTSELAAFTGLGATVWGISPQGLDSHESFARTHGLAFPLLADTERTVARSYGIAVPGLGLRRSVFILDAEGRVHWKHVALAGLGFQSAETLRAQLTELAGDPA
ncbi:MULTISPECIES: peroxiredoxin [unclassified Streptomyces]|uniref:peroxiredoxin n=1 Tax=unclassified Streptomyces TaxID=2593676 RepID=UPI0022B63134|nr:MULTISPECIES: peroxiredoxin [unclassified Streptomyces]MCZ7417310.1 peroxiredoxin [Streptomyces sp. WMMC897]MCZ7432863.1 peroxiredoxin [Streptomyces sp. WMMC1477]